MTGRFADQDLDIHNVLETTLSSGPKRHLKRWLGWIVAILLVVSAIFYWSNSDNSAQPQFKTQTAQKRNLTVTVTATGTLEPINQVEVGSELSGIIENVEVDYNDRVKVGQVLARLDISKFEAEVMKSKASLASAEAKVLEVQATLKEARDDLARIKSARELTHNKTPSRNDLDAAEANFMRAQANLASTEAGVSEAEATLRYNQTDLSKTVIYSPINGIVLIRSVEPGQTVAASLQAPVLFTLAEDLAQMELHIDVDEADVGQVRKGQSAIFTVDAYPERTFTARITQVRFGSKTTDGVVTYEAVLEVDNADLSLRPGMTAAADITVRKIENAILIPNAALRFSPSVNKQKKSRGGLMSVLLPRRPRRDLTKRKDAGKSNFKQVWILYDDGIKPVKVTTGATDGTMTEITGGDLVSGMDVVVDTVNVK